MHRALYRLICLTMIYVSTACSGAPISMPAKIPQTDPDVTNISQIAPTRLNAAVALSQKDTVETGESLSSPSATFAPSQPGGTSTPSPEIIPATPGMADLGEPGAPQVDSHAMVYIPPGEFLMGVPVKGSTFEKNDEKPQHSVYLDGFYIHQTEVTNAMFVQFLNEMGNLSQGGVTWLDADSERVRIHLEGEIWLADPGYEFHPAVEVTWFGADSYCTWSGNRLPSEAEWEKAARSTDGRFYPWGEGIDCGMANYQGCAGDTSPVGSYPDGASPYGVFDMSGNAWEWVADWYGEDYYSATPFPNPSGPPDGYFRVLRSGSCFSPGAYMRTTYREKMSPADSGYYNGFRCARSDG